jgi:hypothetical protein
VVSAGVALYEHLTEATRKAAEQQKTLTDELVKWYDTQRAGEAGAHLKQIEATTRSLVEQQQQYDALTKTLERLQNTYNAKTGLRDDFAIAQTRGALDALASTMQHERDAITAMNAELVKSNNQLRDSMQLALVGQQKLNEAIGSGSVELARLANANALAVEKQRLANTVTAEQLPTFLALAEQMARLKDANIVFTETFKLIEDGARTAAEEVKRYGEALAKIPSTPDAIRAALGVTDAKNAGQAAAFTTQQQLNGLANRGPLGLNVDDTHKAARDMTALAESLERGARSTVRMAEQFGIIGRETGNLVGAITSLVSQTAKLEQTLTAYRNGKGSRSDTIGAAAGTEAGILTLGYGLGSQYGTAGALGGAAAGALAGSQFGPIGAVIGGLTGLASGLFGASKAAEEHRKALEEAARAIHASMTDQMLALGDITQYQSNVQKIMDQAASIRDSIEKTYAGKNNADERNRLLAQENDLEARSIQGLLEKEKAQRAVTDAEREATIAAQALSNAALRSAENMAAWAALEADNQVQLGSLRAHLQAVEDEAKRIAQMQLDTQQNLLSVAKDQLSAQQSAVTSLQRTYDTLKAAQASLLIGPQSILSPTEQYQAARRQLDQTYSLAYGGDATAASQVPDLIKQFLQLSQSLYASTSPYGGDFGYASGLLDTLTDKYGDQLTTAQLQLAETQRQTDYLAQIVTLLGGNPGSGYGATGALASLPPSIPYWALQPDFQSTLETQGQALFGLDPSSYAPGSTYRDLINSGLLSESQFEQGFGLGPDWMDRIRKQYDDQKAKYDASLEGSKQWYEWRWIHDPNKPDDPSAMINQYGLYDNPNYTGPFQAFDDYLYRNSPLSSGPGARGLPDWVTQPGASPNGPGSAGSTVNTVTTGITTIASNSASMNTRLASIDAKIGQLDDIDAKLAALNTRMGAIESQNRLASRGGGLG